MHGKGGQRGACYRGTMLRPSNSLLGSSRAARRASINAERRKWLGHGLRTAFGLIVELVGAAFDLALLWSLPLIYLAASYFVLDLPARWLSHRPAFGAWGVLGFIAALVVSLVGLVRLAQDAPPLAPVRPKFAKAMLAL